MKQTLQTLNAGGHLDLKPMTSPNTTGTLLPPDVQQNQEEEEKPGEHESKTAAGKKGTLLPTDIGGETE